MDKKFHSLVSEESLTQTFNKTKDMVKKMAEHLDKVDYTPLYELDYRLKNDPDLLQEFIKDPSEIIKRETGIVPLDEIHFHFINEKNEYLPAEGSAEQQLMFGIGGKGHSNPWGRVELRFAVGPGCIAACGICP